MLESDVAEDAVDADAAPAEGVESRTAGDENDVLPAWRSFAPK